jgi:hypothetical protein
MMHTTFKPSWKYVAKTHSKSAQLAVGWQNFTPNTPLGIAIPAKTGVESYSPLSGLFYRRNYSMVSRAGERLAVNSYGDSS